MRRHVPQRRGDRRARRARASGSSTTRSCCSSTRHHEDCDVHAAEPPLRRARGRSCSTPPTPDAEPARSRSRAGDELDAGRALAACCCAASRMTELPRDLPAAARRRTSASPARARARALPARPRRLAPVPVAVVPGARGLDARLRRGRPDARSRTSSAARRSSARSRRRRATAGLGLLLDIVPNHMAADDANRYWARPGAARAVLRPRPGDRPPPPLLRHRPPRRRAPGGPGGVRGDARARAAARRARALVDGLRIDHPDGLADPARLPRAAARRRRRARLGGEDPRPRRAAARLAGRGHGRLRVPQRRRGAVRRPGRRGAADRAVGRALRRRPAVRRAAPPRPSSSRRATTFAPEVERLRRDCAARVDRARARARVAARSTAPTSSRGAGRVEDADREALAASAGVAARVLLLEARGGTRSSRASSRRRRR